MYIFFKPDPSTLYLLFNPPHPSLPENTDNITRAVGQSETKFIKEMKTFWTIIPGFIC